jgi:hypothetical protein
MNLRQLSFTALAAAALVASGAASAQSRTYNFADRNIAGAPSGGCNSSLSATSNFSTSFGNAILCQQAGNASTTLGSENLTVRAWSSDGAGFTYRTAGVNDQYGSGFGIANQTEGLTAPPPGHSGDNVTPGVDMWQLTFSAAEALKSITLGWAGVDGDFQVLRWGGLGAAAAIGGRTAAQLLTDGWVLMSTGVGTDNVFNGTNAEPQTFNFNSGNLTSTSWLISAYNSSWAGTGFTHGADEIKLQSVGTLRTGTVSTPGTLALAGMGLLGAAFLRRRG